MNTHNLIQPLSMCPGGLAAGPHLSRVQIVIKPVSLSGCIMPHLACFVRDTNNSDDKDNNMNIQYHNICVSHSVNNGTVPKWGNGTFRPRSVSATVFGETTLISWTFQPQNVNDSANKYERFAAETSLQN